MEKIQRYKESKEINEKIKVRRRKRGECFPYLVKLTVLNRVLRQTTTFLKLNCLSMYFNEFAAFL